MIADLLFKHQAKLVADAPDFRAALEQINDPLNLTLLQGLVLAAAVYEFSPETIIDLRSGMGNSTVVFGLIAHRVGARVHTFNATPTWEASLASLQDPFRATVAVNVTSHGDLKAHDFDELLEGQERVLVFWDAHGYEVAQHVLSRIVPAIADRRHLVLCHDMTDNRYGGSPKSYQEKPIWGLPGPATAYLNVSWVCSQAEQAISIVDFCWRNDLKFHSVDEDLREANADARSGFLQSIDLAENASAHMGYFTMMETAARNFPARL